MKHFQTLTALVVLMLMLTMVVSAQTDESSQSQTLQHATIPALKAIAQDRDKDTEVRKGAIWRLTEMGKEAIPILEEFAEYEQIEIRLTARLALGHLLEKEQFLTKKKYSTQKIEQDPFDPTVPMLLIVARGGSINQGRPDPLSEKVKKLYRQRLAKDPSAQLAWQLAIIIQNGLTDTELQWAAPTDSARSLTSREDPAESYATLAEVLELGFVHSKPHSQLWNKFGTGLAKLRLLQGDWNSMNAMLKQLGQEQIPDESRPLLAAPPVDWEKDLHKRWTIADKSMRSGNCSLEFRIVKDGKGLKGVHFLVKNPPNPEWKYRTGIRTDTLFLAPEPVESLRESFGYMAKDRPSTRYAVSDESGLVRFDKLPKIPVKIEVLVPTANFAEAGSSWDLWMEVEPGKFKMAKKYGGANAVDCRKPPAVVELKEGETVYYPKLVVRPAFDMNIKDLQKVNKDNFELSWQASSTG